MVTKSQPSCSLPPTIRISLPPSSTHIISTSFLYSRIHYFHVLKCQVTFVHLTNHSIITQTPFLSSDILGAYHEFSLGSALDPVRLISISIMSSTKLLQSFLLLVIYTKSLLIHHLVTVPYTPNTFTGIGFLLDPKNHITLQRHEKL